MKELILALFLVWGLFLCQAVYADNQVEIKITQQGFQPAELTIDKDTVVKFINQDQIAHWPASDVHPTHTIYPEFDPQKAIAPGGSWSFKLKKVGTHKYHDHLLPHKRGMLTVVSKEGEAKGVEPLIERVKNTLNNLIYQIRQIFSKVNTGQKYVLDGEKFKNLSSQDQIEGLKKFANSQGVEKIWQFILDTFKGQGGSSGNIHDLAHLTGSLIYTKRGFSGIVICSSEFAFGCYHGFLDKAFKYDLSKLLEAQRACERLGQGGPVASCIHGIGHGVASFYNTTNLSYALAACDKLSNGATYCHDGVFMEFARNAAAYFYEKDDPLHPCDKVEEKYVFACGRNQVRVMIDRLHLIFDEVAKICGEAQNSDFQTACFTALGFDVVAYSNGDDQVILSSCAKITEVMGKAECIKAAAGELIFQNIAGWQSSSYYLCQSLPQTYQKDCFDYINNIKSDYGRRS